MTLLLLWRLARGYRLRPWRSPYLRWRIETYSGLHADQIDRGGFCRFVWQHRRELARYARWAGRMSVEIKKHGPLAGGPSAVNSLIVTGVSGSFTA